MKLRLAAPFKTFKSFKGFKPFGALDYGTLERWTTVSFYQLLL